MAETLPHDEESARRYLRQTRGAREASNIIASAGTRAGFIQNATKRNFWHAIKEQERATRKIAAREFPDETIPGPGRGSPPGDLALFVRTVLNFGATRPRQITARELFALAIIFGVESPRPEYEGAEAFKELQRGDWTANMTRKWEALCRRARRSKRIAK